MIMIDDDIDLMIDLMERCIESLGYQIHFNNGFMTVVFYDESTGIFQNVATINNDGHFSYMYEIHSAYELYDRLFFADGFAITHYCSSIYSINREEMIPRFHRLNPFKGKDKCGMKIMVDLLS